MADKASLIARKHEVIAQIARVRRELERMRAHPTQKINANGNALNANWNN